MATCTHAIGTADTGNTPNASGAFTPSIGDLLIIFVIASDTISATGTLTSSVGLGFTQILRAAFRAGADSIYAFVSNALVSNAASQTVTFDAADAATGTIIFVCRVSGMTKTGLAAILQSAKQDNQGAGTPAPAFASSVLTGNPVLGVIGNSTSPAGMTAPTGWSELNAQADLGYATPTTGGEYVARNSGFTGTTVTWGSASASAFGSMILELDTSSQSVVPVVMAQYRQRI